MSRNYMTQLSDKNFVVDVIRHCTQVCQILNPKKNPELDRPVRDLIRAVVDTDTNAIQKHQRALAASLNNDEIESIQRRAIDIAQASQNLHTNPTGIGHNPDQNFGTHKHIFGILGPHKGYYYGDIFLIFKHEIMLHPDANFTIQAATTYGQKGNAYHLRPWLADPKSEEKRIELFHHTKLHCSIDGYEDAAAMELMALTGMEKKSMDVTLNEVIEHWMNIDSHQVFEAHLPSLIPLDYIDHVYIPKNVFESWTKQAQNLAKSVFGELLTITDHKVNPNATKGLGIPVDNTRISYENFVLDQIKQNMKKTTKHGTVINVAPSNFDKHIVLPITISQSQREYRRTKGTKSDRSDAMFIYWQATSGDMMVSVSNEPVNASMRVGQLVCLICYIAEMPSSDVDDYQESYSYLASGDPYQHKTLVREKKYEASSKSFHRGCNTDDYIMYCLRIDRDIGRVSLIHAGSNSIYNHENIKYQFDSKELDLFKLDYVQISAGTQNVCVQNMIIRHEPIHEWHPSFDKEFKKGSDPFPTKSQLSISATATHLLKKAKDFVFGIDDTNNTNSWIPCTDSVNCPFQFSKGHTSRYSHPCRFSELCRNIADEPHLVHEPHPVPMCSDDQQCKSLGDPIHRSRFRHSNLPDYLVPCRDQQNCPVKRIEQHRIKYSHGEQVLLPSAFRLRSTSDH